MRLWRVILLINLALALGLMLGYLAWGRQALRLEQELQQARRLQAVAGGAPLSPGLGAGAPTGSASAGKDDKINAPANREKRRDFM